MHKNGLFVCIVNVQWECTLTRTSDIGYHKFYSNILKVCQSVVKSPRTLVQSPYSLLKAVLMLHRCGHMGTNVPMSLSEEAFVPGKKL